MDNKAEATTRIAIYGYGGFGRELLAPLRMQVERDGMSNEIVFVDDNPSEVEFDGVPVLSPSDLGAGDRYLIAVADRSARENIEQRCLKAGLVPHPFVAPTARIGSDVILGEGPVLCDFTMVTASVRVGRQFQCNIYSYVAHDCVIGDYVTFAPRVCCNGNVHVKDGAYIGTGAVIRQGRSGKPLIIGENAVVGMGAVVTKNVPAGATVAGVPARILGQPDSGNTFAAG